MYYTHCRECVKRASAQDSWRPRRHTSPEGTGEESPGRLESMGLPRRQCESERRALSWRALDAENPSVGFDQLLRDRQSKSGHTPTPRTGSLAPPESLEDVWQNARRNAYARV